MTLAVFCRVCKKLLRGNWSRRRAVHLDCVGTGPLAVDLLAVRERFPVSIDRMAGDLGVSTYVLKAWLNRAKRKRAA